MGRDTVFAHGKAVATQTTAHGAKTDGKLDIRLAPNKPQPLLNYEYSKAIVGGSSTVKYAGAMIWIGRAEIPVSKNAPDLPKGAGVKSGTCYGRIVCPMGDPLVYVDGTSVCRLGDVTTHNNGNAMGHIVLASEVDAAVAAANAEAAAVAPDAGTDPDGGTKPDGDKPPDDGETDPEKTEGEGEAPEKPEECQIVTAMICDGEKPARKVSGKAGGTKKGILEISIEGGGGEVKLVATTKGECAEEHFHWHVALPEGAKDLKEAKAEFKLPASATHGAEFESHGLKAILALPHFTPKEVPVSAIAHPGSPQVDFVVRGYPGDEVTFAAGSAEFETLTRYVQMLLKLQKIFGCKLEFHFLVGSIALSMQWLPKPASPLCYWQGRAEGGFKPLIGIAVKVPLPWGPLEPIHRVLEDFEEYFTLELSIEFSGALDTTGRITVAPKLPLVQGEFLIKATFGVAIIFELKVAADWISVEAKIGGSVSLWGRLFGLTNLSALTVGMDFGANLNPVKGEFTASITLSKIKFFGHKLEASYKVEKEFWPQKNIFDIKGMVVWGGSGGSGGGPGPADI